MGLNARIQMDAKPHTAVYRMHKYFARRPWNVFAELVSIYTSEGEIVLDPFCGGGVTVVEALKLRRRAIGVDVNPLATYVTSMECRPVNLSKFVTAFKELSERAGDEISSYYIAQCSKCGSEAIADWFEWDEKANQIIRLKYNCSRCGSLERAAKESDQRLVRKTERSFADTVRRRGLWFPTTPILPGDKTNSLLAQGFGTFRELFTKRNLLALSILRKEIENTTDEADRKLLSFLLSSSLKWASRQSHLRGKIVEGWAIHAYWVYARSLEMNVWNVYKRRYRAVLNGKMYSEEHIGDYCKFGQHFSDLVDGPATCLLLNQDAAGLPIPDNSVDAVITDPPYGANVNYAELTDFWYIWMSHGQPINKKDEIVINKTQGKTIDDYETRLGSVFKECNRVLKPSKYFVSTFNSKDFRIVASFIMAASRAGLRLLPEGVVYQKPIRPYMTTFHAMQIGAFVGDFIFTFKKEPIQSGNRPVSGELQRLRDKLSQLIEKTAKSGRPEPALREQAYKELIPFLAKYASTDEQRCKDAVDFFESEIREYEKYFKMTRKRLTERRKRVFLN